MEGFIKILFWLRIFISPFLIGLILSVIVFFALENPFNLYTSAAMLILGLVFGILYAEKVRRKRGGVEHLSANIKMKEFQKTSIEKKD